MAIRIIAQRRVLKIGKNPGVKKFVMRPELYTSLTEKKVFSEAATHSGISAGVIKAAWDAAGEVIRTWATEGHSVPLPGLGTMRFSVRSKAVAELEDVKTSLISTRRIVFTPSVDVKDELKGTLRTMRTASPPAPLQRARGVETQEAVIPEAETTTTHLTRTE